MKCLIIIPAYNEEKNIISVINNLITNYPQYDYVIINDGSTDNTEQVCKEHGFHYVTLPSNLGIGGGVQTGYLYAKENNYDIAVQIDGDGQHNPQYIQDAIEQLNKGFDMVIGSRFIAKEGFQSSGIRRVGISFLSTIIKILCHTKIYDVTSGFRICNRKMIEFFAQNYAQDYPEPEAIVNAVLHNFRVSEIPVVMNERLDGKSSISSLKSIYYMIKVSISLVLTKITLDKKGDK